METINGCYKARTVKVVDPTTVEARIELPFGISAVRYIQLKGVPPAPTAIPDLNKAKHCAIVIFGGKPFFIKFDGDGRGKVVGDVFIKGKVSDKSKSVDIGGIEHVNVKDIYEEVASRGYDVDFLKKLLNA